MHRTLLAIAVASVMITPAWAANDGPDLTVYRSDNAQLFSAGDVAVNDGYAVIHERRKLQLTSGTHDLTVGNLPDYLDPEAVALSFSGSKAQVLSQRLLLPQGQNGTLTGHIGKSITVLGANGEKIAQGTLVHVGSDGSLVIGGDVFGPTVVHDYTAVRLTGGVVGGGSRLQLRVDAPASGGVEATLTYPTSGLGWRAAYTGTLQQGSGCHLQLRAQASIANRSGRAWENADIKLVAGEPHFAKSSGPRPVMETMSARKSDYAPRQGKLGDYRTYTLPGAVNLPNDSVTLTPLYKAHTLSCQRTWLFTNGGSYSPPRPQLNPGNDSSHEAPVASTLSFHAFDSFPAGYLRVLTVDNDGNAEFLGEGRVADTPKGHAVSFTLGNAFDLRGTRERTSFNVDKASRQMDEGYRITLTNAGDDARTVTVREHPNRWRNWTLTSSSIKPSKQTTDTLEFRVPVPANGSATLDYAVQYTWTASDD